MASMKELDEFNYAYLDAPTAKFLQECESEIGETLGQAATRVGKILTDAQDRLAKHGYGCFGLWIKHMGYPRRSAYELIDRYKSFVRLTHNQREIFESLPMGLSKKISAKSAESTAPKRKAKQAVLNGDIKTSKEYRELLARLEAEETLRKQAEQLRDIAEDEVEVLRDTIESMSADPESTTEEESSDSVRVIDDDLRKQFYYDFVDELDYLRRKYGAIALEGYEFRKAIEDIAAKRDKVDGFDDFWQTFVKSTYQNQTIIEMEEF